jgi:hypothetical protein
MFVAIPFVEIDEFFLNRENLDAYLDLITRAYGITYTVATSEEIDGINFATCPSVREDVMVLKINSPKKITNKHFNVAYNTMRYLWYHQYTNMAIIATNLYRLDLLSDALDVLAIAFSFQATNGRAVLPSPTIDIAGLLYFRPFEDILRELELNTLFNSVFYKYPVYFNPEVKVKGSFFEDAEMTIKAKEIINRLVGVMSIQDMPGSMTNNLRLICKDYMTMKDTYLNIIGQLSKMGASVSKDTPVLLSVGKTDFDIYILTPTGSSKKINIKV